MRLNAVDGSSHICEIGAEDTSREVLPKKFAVGGLESIVFKAVRDNCIMTSPYEKISEVPAITQLYTSILQQFKVCLNLGYTAACNFSSLFLNSKITLRA